MQRREIISGYKTHSTSSLLALKEKPLSQSLGPFQSFPELRLLKFPDSHHSLTHSFIYLPIHPSIHPPIYPSVHPFIHRPVQSMPELEAGYRAKPGTRWSLPFEDREKLHCFCAHWVFLLLNVVIMITVLFTEHLLCARLYTKHVP